MDKIWHWLCAHSWSSFSLSRYLFPNVSQWPNTCPCKTPLFWVPCTKSYSKDIQTHGNFTITNFRWIEWWKLNFCLKCIVGYRAQQSGVKGLFSLTRNMKFKVLNNIFSTMDYYLKLGFKCPYERGHVHLPFLSFIIRLFWFSVYNNFLYYMHQYISMPKECIHVSKIEIFLHDVCILMSQKHVII